MSHTLTDGSIRPEPTLFDWAEGERRRQASMTAVEDTDAAAQLRTDWLAVIEQVTREHDLFTQDDVVRAGLAAGLTEPSEARVFGPWMLHAAREGWCVKTAATVQSERVKLHRGLVQVWASTRNGRIWHTCPTCDGLAITTTA